MKIYDEDTGQELALDRPIRTSKGVVRLVAKRGVFRRRAVVRYNGGNPVTVDLKVTPFYPGRLLRLTGTANFGR